MGLCTISSRYPHYKSYYFSGGELKGFFVYSADRQQVGYVTDLLIDDTDCIQYLVVKLKSWRLVQKQVLLPVDCYAYNSGEDRIYIPGLSKEKIQQLPLYNPDQTLDDGYEIHLLKRCQEIIPFPVNLSSKLGYALSAYR